MPHKFDLVVAAAIAVLCLVSFRVSFAVLYYPHSSCNQDTPWQKGNGAPIRSFLKSIQPVSLGMNNSRVFASFGQSRRVATGIADKHESRQATGWKRFGTKEFDGWLYGRFTDMKKLTGDNLTFLYDDYVHGLKGSWDRGVMVSARRVKIKAYRCKNGLLHIKTTNPRPDSHEFRFEQPGVGFVTSHPTVMNAYDMHAVYIKNSSIPGVVGDGIFAKRDFIQGSLVAYYAGAHLYDYSTVMFDNMTMEQREERHKNLLSFNDDYDLDCPQGDIVKYRAALGHKANHAFKANVRFCFVKSPRFGETRCLEATRDIEKGEEITVDYRYNLDSDYVPRWYLKLYYETYPDEWKKLKTEDKIKVSQKIATMGCADGSCASS